MSASKLGQGLAKAFCIQLDYRNERDGKVSRGESTYSVESADTYVEQEPTSAEWIRSVTPSGRDLLHYVYNLFPFTHWITRYNLQWFYGDLVAGITIGAIVVPQGMAYATLAQLPVQFGLYSSFMGVLIYWFFATSKDITIGPVAVLSQVVGTVVLEVSKKDKSIPGYQVASALSIIVGAIVVFIGFARLGWLVEFISLASIAAYMTGSALNIAVGQVPALMGITGFSTRDSTYLVIINTLKGLPRTKLDAAMGLTALLMLYLIRYGFEYMARRQPQRRKLYFFCSTLRTAFVILLYTLISLLANLHLNKKKSGNSPFKILGPVPRGFQNAGVPRVDSHIISLFASQIPVTVIVVLIEHISIAKSFGRINNYTIDPSQEMIAIGVTNLLGPFLGAYPATGSFSRTAIKSKAGVRTPLAGFITAIVVLLAIYALPAVFFYIPSASLSAVIIHAVLDLITPLNTVYQFWRVSPLEVFIYLAGVIVIVFTTIEDGIYVTIATSLALLLFRVFKAQGRFLGKVKAHSVVGDQALDGLEAKDGKFVSQVRAASDPDKSARNVFIPIDHGDGSNPQIPTEHPYPGVFIYRFSEGFNYPNAGHYTEYLVKEIFAQTKRTNPAAYPRPGDRPWNDPGPRKGQPIVPDTHKPTLKAVILDFASVNNVDITSVQNLIDVRNQLDRYTSPDRVQWHFANIHNRWTKRALASAGFGYPSVSDGAPIFSRWKPIFSVAELGGFHNSAAAEAEAEQNRRAARLAAAGGDVENGRATREIDGTEDSEGSRDSLDRHLSQSKAYKSAPDVKIAVVHGLSRPFFHVDLTAALQSAVHTAEAIEQRQDAAATAEAKDRKL